jgi:hypothetical protein
MGKKQGGLNTPGMFKKERYGYENQHPVNRWLEKAYTNSPRLG